MNETASARSCPGRLAAIVLLTGALSVGGPARADGDPATVQVPMLLPYSGVLELDGRQVSGQIEMEFDIYDGAGSSSSVWNERHTVDVQVGRFSVMLGSSSASSATNLVGVIQNADDLYVGITLHAGGDAVVLDGRKRLVPTAYSMWSMDQTDLRVVRNLSVGNQTTTDTLVATTVASATAVHVTDRLSFAAGGSMKGLQLSDEYEAVSSSGEILPAPTVVPMKPVAKSICFITQNHQQHQHGVDLDFNSTATCSVQSNGETWSLYALGFVPHWPAGGPSMAVTCRARCLEWDW